MSPELESSVNAFYHLTSVFDTTIYEALSKVIQKLIPEQAMLERLLDLLCQVRGLVFVVRTPLNLSLAAKLNGQSLPVRYLVQDLHRDRFFTTR